ncbi:FAD:protein FMN transferase [Mycolicibacterium sp. CBM1]
MPSSLVNPGQSQWSRWSTDMHLLVTSPAVLARARAVVDAELERIERAASRFRPDTEICALAAADGARTAVSPVLADLIEAAVAVASLTEGDVDPTVGSALIALGYDRDIADIADVAVGLPIAASLTVPADWSMIEFDGRSVRLPAGVVLDLGATAKAVAADRCARRVLDETGSGVLVNLGGDIATAGPPPPGDWPILVQDTPDDPGGRVTLGADAGLATSSTRRRRWWHGNELVHHILDPRTGRCAEPVWRSVSVAAGNCLAANAISTACVVRGHRAPDWVVELDVPARFVGADGTVRMVGGWPES